MPPPPSSPSDSGYETGGNNAEEDDEYDFYAHNRPPSPVTPPLFPSPPRQKQLRLARKQQEAASAAAAAAAEQLRNKHFLDKLKELQQERANADDNDDDENFDGAADGRQLHPRTLSMESASSASFDIIPDDEAAAVRRQEKAALDKKHDEEYFKRVTDQSVSGFGVHAVQEGLKDLKMRTEPVAKRIEESRWMKKTVGTPEELGCPCWNYPDEGWRFCPFHEPEAQDGGVGKSAGDVGFVDEGVVEDEDDKLGE
ncbi:uncharacterized protein LTHEOB_9227 [Lasiodiplodia theobromae]|uniref:uncharacterized protein n=1 Tax=Lasiodiplodia theobromae TaxID=45133 RepID=UPI0015C338A7|nr:uncharacterized protein LTHEOB_9227 [Lasiodiplodia theobromae]KAF4540556.1 hypothetical protein LTHEOB_9227 [Lasiodiplodia theobromae]